MNDEFDDDFYMDDDELAEQNALGVVSTAKLSIVENIKNLAEEMEMNLKLNESTDYENNSSMLTEKVDILLKLDELSKQQLDLSDEEVQNLINEIMKSTTQLTFGNMDKYLKDSQTNQTKKTKSDDDFDF